MSAQFSVDSIEYLAEKLSHCGSLSDESLAYLTRQTSGLISDLLQNACKILRRCRRKDLTTEDFALALKLHQLSPMYGGYTTTNLHRCSFHKLKKDNRILYHIEDNILSLNQSLTVQSKVPLDLSIRTHWLAVNGKQPATSENPVLETPAVRSLSQKKSTKTSHILSLEQQMYYKQLTETCICSNHFKRQQALAILSSDGSLALILSRLMLFIAEGVRVNLTPRAPFDRSIMLHCLLQMTDALIHNASLCLEPYLQHLLPAVLSCLLERRMSRDHWALRDLAGKCSGAIIRKYTTAANRLQQRTIDVFYRILSGEQEEHTWSTYYGALIGMCEMSDKVIIQLVFPLVKRLGEQMRLISDIESVQKITEVVVRFITKAYRSVHNENECREKKLDEDFGSYFAPFIQQQLILLL